MILICNFSLEKGHLQHRKKIDTKKSKKKEREFSEDVVCRYNIEPKKRK